MKKSVVIGIIVGIILLIIGIFFVVKYIGKECKTDIDCLTKTCFTVQCTDKKCAYSLIANCCGNEICEVGEAYPECVADCPDCDDVNECTKDSYDYHEKTCVNKPILNVVCCGNGLCEIGETYENCVRDCPNCDDENQCTEDSYDYHEQKCINEPIVTCCGNDICERGETYENCARDCPNPDDFILKHDETPEGLVYKWGPEYLLKSIYKEVYENIDEDRMHSILSYGFESIYGVDETGVLVINYKSEKDLEIELPKVLHSYEEIIDHEILRHKNILVFIWSEVGEHEVEIVSNKLMEKLPLSVERF